jgi:hypothetical protein
MRLHCDNFFDDVHENLLAGLPDKIGSLNENPVVLSKPCVFSVPKAPSDTG